MGGHLVTTGMTKTDDADQPGPPFGGQQCRAGNRAIAAPVAVSVPIIRAVFWSWKPIVPSQNGGQA